MALYEVLEKYIQEVFSAPDSTIIYHYTDIVSLTKIIKTGYFKLSRHEELNKKNNRELNIGPSIVREQIQNSTLSPWLPRFDKFIKVGFRLRVGSFSEEENYSYAIEHYGKGCIGFKTAFLKQFCNKNSGLLGRVEYNLKKQKKIISKMFNLYEEAREDPNVKRESLFRGISLVLPLFKEEKDEIDQECRVITTEITDPNNCKIIVGQPSIKGLQFSKDKFVINRGVGEKDISNKPRTND